VLAAANTGVGALLGQEVCLLARRESAATLTGERVNVAACLAGRSPAAPTSAARVGAHGLFGSAGGLERGTRVGTHPDRVIADVLGVA